MLIEFYMMYQIILVVLFMLAFFTKHEILWTVSFVMAGFLMFTSFYIEKTVYVFNTTISAYSTTTMSYSYPFLMGINLLFCSLALLLGFFDLFEKYGDGGDKINDNKQQDR